MKKTIYLSLCALLLTTLTSLRAGATGVIATHMDIGGCYISFDSLIVSETGYLTGDQVILDYGDGTIDTVAAFSVSSGTGWYEDAHTYGSLGTYSRKIVLLSGGLRVDSIVYSYTWMPCKSMNVVLYDDNNSDCTLDAGDTYFWYTPATVEIDSAGVPVDTVTATYWVWYQAYGPSGTVYTFKVINNPHGFLPSCPSSGLVNITVGGATYYEDTIGFKCDTTVCTDNAIAAANFCPGAYYGWSYMAVTSTSCTTVSATLDMTFSPKYTVDAVYGASSYTISGNTITLTLPGISASSPAAVSIGFNPVGTLTIGDTVNTSWRLNPFTGDCDTTNNVVSSVDTILSSWDPNHKSVQPDGNIVAGQNLKYTLTFENTGNATATNIHIMDTLSDNLDINSIKQTGSSARAEMILLKWGTHNVVKFDFPNINLLDSTHHGQCEGFVDFSINAKTPLAPGTTIDNKAGIYFDVNPVVMTNNVENKIVAGTTGVGKVRANSIAVYPNPVSGMLTVNTGNVNYNTLSITNTLGQVLVTQPVNSTLTRVNVSELPSGMYYITLKGATGVAVQKFEKL